MIGQYYLVFVIAKNVKRATLLTRSALTSTFLTFAPTETSDCDAPPLSTVLLQTMREGEFDQLLRPTDDRLWHNRLSRQRGVLSSKDARRRDGVVVQLDVQARHLPLRLPPAHGQLLVRRRQDVRGALLQRWTHLLQGVDPRHRNDDDYDD